MRGAKGTLLAKAGNAFDQSVLLAYLLGDSGFETRIVRGELSPSDAKRLVNTLGSQPTVQDSGNIDIEYLRKIYSKLLVLNGVATERANAIASNEFKNSSIEKLASEFAAVKGDAKKLIKVLQESGVRLTQANSYDHLIAEAVDYAWVEYSTGPTGSWKAVHPAFVANGPQNKVKVVSYFKETVPDDLLHKFRIQLFVEKRAGNTIESLAVSSPWERPTANLVGRPLTMSNVSMELAAIGSDAWSMKTDDLFSIISSSETFTPVFNGGYMPGSLTFDIQTGTVVDPDTAASSYAGVFKQVSKNTKSAADVLSNLGLKAVPDEINEDAVSIISQFIEITLTAPGGKKTIHKRWILPPPEWRKNKQPGFYLSRIFTLMVDVGPLPEGFVADKSLERLIRQKPAVKATLMRMYGKDGQISRSATKIAPIEWGGSNDLIAAFNVAESGIGWRSAPAVHIHTNEIDPDENDSIDIVLNPRRVIVHGPEEVQLDLEAILVAGVWETRAEALIGGRGKVHPDSAIEKLTTGMSAGSSYEVITHEQQIIDKQRNVGQQAVSMIKRDLKAGFTIILPKTYVQDDVTWWRVNPVTGETLGIGSQGRGTSAAEDINVRQFISLALIPIGIVGGFGMCAKDLPAGAYSLVCCFGVTAGGTLVGMGIGSKIASATGSLIFDVAWNVGSNVAPNLCE